MSNKYLYDTIDKIAAAKSDSWRQWQILTTGKDPGAPTFKVLTYEEAIKYDQLKRPFNIPDKIKLGEKFYVVVQDGSIYTQYGGNPNIYIDKAAAKAI